MGSVKFKDLKAYVRYDGSGRVVAGSLVFRKKKPKNGRWSEISSNLCCNANPSSTTTTTTQGGGITTQATLIYESTSGGSGYPQGFDNGGQCAADVPSYPAMTVYFSTPLVMGTPFFTDNTLTTPIEIETGDGYWHYKLIWSEGMTFNNSDVTFNGSQFSNKTVNTVTSC